MLKGGKEIKCKPYWLRPPGEEGVCNQNYIIGEVQYCLCISCMQYKQYHFGIKCILVMKINQFENMRI